MASARIPNLGDLGQLLLDAAGVDYEPYSFAIGEEDFDRDDDFGPGEYSGVILHDPGVARRWDAGLAACREAKIATGSRAGLLIRLGHLTGKELSRLPAEIEAMVAGREAKERAAESRHEKELAEVEALRAKVEALMVGGRVVWGGHPGLNSHVDPDRRPKLTLLVENPFHDKPFGFDLPGTTCNWRDIYRMPDGDLSVHCGFRNCVVTFRP